MGSGRAAAAWVNLLWHKICNSRKADCRADAPRSLRNCLFCILTSDHVQAYNLWIGGATNTTNRMMEISRVVVLSIYVIGCLMVTISDLKPLIVSMATRSLCARALWLMVSTAVRM
ncbi:hypothetical protein ACP70R_003302 [Stipagrostis hirtigluma subsp. patula]